MNILEVYQKYQIMPQLVEHQLRVAAVADMICEHFQGEIERRDIVAASLLHDMGNIVKFNFDQTVEYQIAPGEITRLDYWKQVKQKVIDKYGPGSHNVTRKIVEEVPVGNRVRELVESVGFTQGIVNA